LIGGRVENTELAKQALIRESEEETGIQLLPENLELAHVLHKKTLRAIRITLYFKAKVWSGDAVSKELNKFKSVEWFYLDNLPRNLSPTAKFVLEQYRSGKYYSELS
ncbi:MAG: NUDIX domain-containing protein, partial [Saprospiraceae bacterium]